MVTSVKLNSGVPYDATHLFHHLTSKLSPTSMVAMLEGPFTQHLQERSRQRFFHHGDDASGDWARLQPTTFKLRLSGKARGGYTGSTRTLNHTGDLRRFMVSATGTATPTGAGSRMTWPSHIGGVEDKLTAAQVGVQNHFLFGRPLGKGMSPRPVVAADGFDATILRNMTWDWVKKGL